MPLPAPSIAVQQVLAAAAQALQAGNLAAAEMALAPFFSGRLIAHPDLAEHRRHFADEPGSYG